MEQEQFELLMQALEDIREIIIYTGLGIILAVLITD